MSPIRLPAGVTISSCEFDANKQHSSLNNSYKAIASNQLPILCHGTLGPDKARATVARAMAYDAADVGGNAGC